MGFYLLPTLPFTEDAQKNSPLTLCFYLHSYKDSQANRLRSYKKPEESSNVSYPWNVERIVERFFEPLFERRFASKSRAESRHVVIPYDSSDLAGPGVNAADVAWSILRFQAAYES